MNKWYIENGDQGDVVISTRVRLARNLEEYPFPCRLTVKGKEKVCEEIKNAVLSDDHWGFGFTWMKDFTRSQAVSLAERHLVSPEFVSDRAGRGLLLTDDEAISIMLCEEDHIRLQVMMAGLALKEAYSVADKVDNIIDLIRAFSDDILGFKHLGFDCTLAKWKGYSGIYQYTGIFQNCFAERDRRIVDGDRLKAVFSSLKAVPPEILQ